MNYHSECLRQLGKCNLDYNRIAHEYAARHPKEFLEFVAPDMFPKTVTIKLTETVTNTLDKAVFKRCKQAAKELMLLPAVKTIRELTGWGLFEAKILRDKIVAGTL